MGPLSTPALVFELFQSKTYEQETRIVVHGTVRFVFLVLSHFLPEWTNIAYMMSSDQQHFDFLNYRITLLRSPSNGLERRVIGRMKMLGERISGAVKK